MLVSILFEFASYIFLMCAIFMIVMCYLYDDVEQCDECGGWYLNSELFPAPDNSKKRVCRLCLWKFW